MNLAAKCLRDNNDLIIRAWEKRVQSEISASKDTPSLILRNQLPHVLEDISEIMDKYADFEDIRCNEQFLEIIDNSLDHGRHRATTANYTVSGILKEYLVFHQVLTDVLKQHKVYSEETGIILMFTIETAMINSAEGFNTSLNEMKEKLVGTLAHDIRNPISAAYLALNMIDSGAEPERLRKVKKMAVKSLDHSIKLIEGLLDAIKVEAGEGITMNFSTVNIIEDVKWVVNEASMIFPNKITLNASTPKVMGVFDGTAIRRVLENLVTNAVKYGEVDSEIFIDVEDTSQHVFITVKNFGTPISEEKQMKIFEFLQSEPADKSKGLKSWGMGLSLVKIVTEAHGGMVEVTSKEGDGTAFKITLGKFDNEPGKVKSQINYETGEKLK